MNHLECAWPEKGRRLGTVPRLLQHLEVRKEGVRQGAWRAPPWRVEEYLDGGLSQKPAEEHDST